MSLSEYLTVWSPAYNSSFQTTGAQLTTEISIMVKGQPGANVLVRGPGVDYDIGYSADGAQSFASEAERGHGGHVFKRGYF
jgi:hypothetical protein